MTDSTERKDVDSAIQGISVIPRFSLKRMFVVGLVGTIAALVVFASIGFVFQKLFEEDGMVLQLVVFAPIGFGYSVGRYLSGLRRVGALNVKSTIIALAVCCVVGFLSGIAGMESVHRSINDSWPLIMTLGVLGIMVLQILWPGDKQE